MPLETNQKEYTEAALLIAQGEMQYGAIADRLNVARQTLFNWRRESEFKQLVSNHVAELVAEVRSFSIGQLHNRVKALQDRHSRLERIIEERAKSDQMQGVPGGTTGLLVHNVKSIGSGDSAVRVDVYELDTGLLNELRAIELQSAKELGQWIDKSETKTDATIEFDENLPGWLKAPSPEPQD